MTMPQNSVTLTPNQTQQLTDRVNAAGQSAEPPYHFFYSLTMKTHLGVVVSNENGERLHAESIKVRNGWNADTITFDEAVAGVIAAINSKW
jgi:hypothetical protein